MVLLHEFAHFIRVLLWGSSERTPPIPLPSAAAPAAPRACLADAPMNMANGVSKPLLRRGRSATAGAPAAIAEAGEALEAAVCADGGRLPTPARPGPAASWAAASERLLAWDGNTRFRQLHP